MGAIGRTPAQRRRPQGGIPFGCHRSYPPSVFDRERLFLHVPLVHRRFLHSSGWHWSPDQCLRSRTALPPRATGPLTSVFMHSPRSYRSCVVMAPPVRPPPSVLSRPPRQELPQNLDRLRRRRQDVPHHLRHRPVPRLHLSTPGRNLGLKRANYASHFPLRQHAVLKYHHVPARSPQLSKPIIIKAACVRICTFRDFCIQSAYHVAGPARLWPHGGGRTRWAFALLSADSVPATPSPAEIPYDTAIRAVIVDVRLGSTQRDYPRQPPAALRAAV